MGQVVEERQPDHRPDLRRELLELVGHHDRVDDPVRLGSGHRVRGAPGAVGQLQLEVLISRLEAEYKVEAGLEASPFATARWLKGTQAALDEFEQFNRANLARDRDGTVTFLLVRETAELRRSGLVHGFAGNHHPTAAPPTLRLSLR